MYRVGLIFQTGNIIDVLEKKIVFKFSKDSKLSMNFNLTREFKLTKVFKRDTDEIEPDS
jgi:hypothetical protein